MSKARSVIKLFKGAKVGPMVDQAKKLEKARDRIYDDAKGEGDLGQQVLAMLDELDLSVDDKGKNVKKAEKKIKDWAGWIMANADSEEIVGDASEKDVKDYVSFVKSEFKSAGLNV